MSMTGDEAMKRKILAVAKEFPEKVKRALYFRCTRILIRSQEEFVPEDKRILRNSGRVDDPEVSGTVISCSITYGGLAGAYAIAVHEHPSNFSPPSWQGVEVTFHPAGRGPEYLKIPLFEAIPTLARDLAKDLHL
jgi:hypothetical protein